MSEAEIGEFVVQSRALYRFDTGKWQPILCMTRLHGARVIPVSQTFNYLPALFETETDAIRYGFMKGRALVKGDVLGLTI
jgi:hypothetical protein